jgi:membrane dipeptidase
MSERLTRREFVERGGVAGAAVVLLGSDAAMVPGSGMLRQAAGPQAPQLGRPPALVIDAAAPMASPGRGFDAFRAYLQRSRRAGVNVVFAPCATRDRYDSATRNVLALRAFCDRLKGEALLIESAADLDALAGSSLIGVIAHFQGLQMVEEQLALLAGFRAQGVVVMQLTSDWKNFNGDGCLERSDLPLTGLGRMVVEEKARAKIVLDLAHAGRKTSLEALERTTGPVIFSHANAAAVHDHPRNLTDDQLRACAAKGGVIGLTAFPALLGSGTRPGVDAFLRHLDHVIQRTGIEHVGLGLDFDDMPKKRFTSDPLPDPPYAYPAGLASVDGVLALRDRLAREGYREDDLQRLFGLNFARVLRRALAASG